MTTTNDSTPRVRRLREMKLAQAQIEDDIDMQDCVSDLQTRLGMNQGTARVVASALRAKMFPNAARAEGLDDRAISKLMQRTSQFGAPLTADFAKDTPKHNDLAGAESFDDPESRMGDGGEEEAEHEGLDDEISEHGHVPTSMEEAEEGEMPDMHSPDVADAIHGADMAHGHTSLMKDDPHADEGADADAPEFEGDNDFSEANDDGGLATIEIQVPANQVEKVKQLLEQVLGDSLTDDTDMDGGDPSLGDEDDLGGEEEDIPSDDTFKDSPDAGSPFGGKKSPAKGPSEFGGKESGISDEGAEESGDDGRPQKGAFSANSRKVRTSMDKATLAARKAQREAVLASTRTASEEGKKPENIGLGTDTSSNGKPFQFAGEAQYKDEDKYPTMTLQGSEGNSLRDQNPDYAKQDIPTKNPENLGLKSGYNAVTKEGSEKGDLDYVVDFDMLTNVPSGDPDRGGDFDVPTQMGEMPRKRTASVEDDPEEELYQLLTASGVSDKQVANMTFAQGLALYRKITASRLHKLAKFAEAPLVEVTAEDEKDEEKDKRKASHLVPDKDEEKGDGPRLNIQPNGDGFTPGGKSEDPDEKTIKEASAADYRARLKTAYAVSSKLYAAGIIAADEVDKNAEMYLNDGLSTRQMLNTGAQVLRLGQSAAERIASTQTERSVRTASTNNGLANVPAFNSASSNNSAPADLREALRLIDWSAPRREEIDA